MDDIAAALSISKRTLYEMFEDKENLLLESIRFQHEVNRRKIENIASQTDNPLEVFALVFNMKMEEVHKVSPQFISDAKRFQSNLTAYEQEIKKIRKDANDRERQSHDVNVRAAKAKNEFLKLKPTYDEEKKEKDKELEALRAAAAAKAEGIEPAFMERYRDIKKHSVPPLAALYGDQCGGCNMSRPSSVSRRVKAGELVECETCGRLLIIVNP